MRNHEYDAPAIPEEESQTTGFDLDPLLYECTNKVALALRMS